MSKEYLLRLPKSGPERLATMTNRIISKQIITTVEHKSDMATLFTYAPILPSPEDIDNIKTKEEVMANIKQLFSRTRWEIIVNNNLFEQELNFPTVSIRNEAATTLLNFSGYALKYSRHGIRLFPLLVGLYSLSHITHGSALLVSGKEADFITKLFGQQSSAHVRLQGLATLVVGLLTLYLTSVLLTRNAKKYSIKRAKQLGYIVSSEHQLTPLDEGLTPNISKQVISALATSIKNGNFTKVNQLSKQIITKLIPSGTKSYKSIMKYL